MELKILANCNEFIVSVLQKSLAELKAKQNLKQAIAGLQQQADENGFSFNELEKLLGVSPPESA